MHNRRRLHNRIAESELTLPACAVLSAVLWCWPSRPWLVDSWVEGAKWLGSLLAMLLVAYVVLETNNVNQLIRIRTRMMSSLWCLLAGALPLLHQCDAPLFVALCAAVSYNLLFRCYQLTNASGPFFYAIVALSLASLTSPLLLLLALPCFYYLTVFLRAMSLRTLCAGLLGMALPYFFWAVWCFLHDDMTPLQNHLQELLLRPTMTLQQLPLVSQITAGVLAFFAVVGLLHYWRRNYNDKIRTRQLLYVYVVQSLVLFALLAWHPECFTALVPVIAVTIISLLAHYFALIRTWFSSVVFALSTLIYAGLAYINLWNPSLHF